jgi:hypothetical protein
MADDERQRRERFQQQQDDAYRALGRYVAEFSRLIFHMRIAMSIRLSPTGDLRLAELALGEATAGPITSSFFAMCLLTADLDDDEKSIAGKLQEAVTDEIKRRNDFAHGDWWIGWGPGTGEMSAPKLGRVKPGRGKGDFKSAEQSAATLDALSDSLSELRNLVGEFGDICFKQHAYHPALHETAIRVRDVLTLQGSRRSGHVIRRPDADGTVDYS